MGVYDRQIKTATRLIKEKGQVVTWKVLADGAPVDPLKPWLPSGGVPEEKEVIIVFLPHTKENKQFLRYMKQSEVETGFLTGLMAQVDFAPQIKDVVVRDGVELTVETIDIISPNGENILYALEFGS